jgi:hypothetical protein
MPFALREIVRRWVGEDRWTPSPKGPDAICISGGPAYCTLLDAEGAVFHWWPWDDSIVQVPDGSCKIQEIVIGAEHYPELSQWLPRKPPTAVIALGRGG